jgi:hypothetical protein
MLLANSFFNFGEYLFYRKLDFYEEEYMSLSI